jgi:hypothetical protein
MNTLVRLRTTETTSAALTARDCHAEFMFGP